MNRRGLNSTGTNLGDSTSCLLTFQHDMLESSYHWQDESIDDNFFNMTLTSRDTSRSSTPYRARVDNEVLSSCNKPRSSTAYRVRSDDAAHKLSDKPRSSTTNRLSHVDGGESSSRIKSGSQAKFFDTKSNRSKSVTPSRKMRGDHDDTTMTSATTATTSIMPLEPDSSETADSKPNAIHRLRHTPPGRSRPGIRTHRSGSFALRQFKENYDKKQNRRPKTKAEARLKDTIENEITETSRSMDSVSNHSKDWVKPALRPYRSADGSFRIQGDAKSTYCYEVTSSASKNDNLQSRSQEMNQRREFEGGSKFKRSMVEVAPGCSMLFCGIDETMNALHLDRIVHAECSSCNTFLACINVAAMVLCPGCQTVSPIESTSISHSFDCAPVMGIGLRVEDILAHLRE